MDGFRTAVRVAVEAGFAPTRAERVPAFLFLTGQWERYDAADPDGRLLRVYAGDLPPWDFERDRLRRTSGPLKRYAHRRHAWTTS